MSKDKRNIILAFIIGMLFMGGTFSFAYFLMDIIGTGSNLSKLSTGTLELNINDESVNINNLSPIDDIDYEKYAYKKEFEIINNGTLNGCTDIYLDIKNISQSLKSKYFKYKLVSNTDTYTGDFTEVENNRLLLANESMIESPKTKKYTLYIWLSYDENENQNELLGTSMKGTLGIESKDCKSLVYDYETTAFYVDNNKVEELNNKMDYKLISYTCKNGQTVTYNNTDKSIIIKPILKKTACVLYFEASYTKEFAYKGNYEEFIVPGSGYYKIELWGAQGGSYDSNSGGNGAYTSGIIYLNDGEKLYLYVGGQGGQNTSHTNLGGYNGGGYSGSLGTGSTYNLGGGGATDIRYFNTTPSSSDLKWNSILGINSRIIVAGGGGGSVGNINETIITGQGGLIGTNGGGSYSAINPTGGTQINAGTGHNHYTVNSSFGSSSQEHSNGWGGGGGSGYYGGSTGYGKGGAGGSSFISGYAGVNGIVEGSTSEPRSHTNNTLHYSGKYFIDGKMNAGVNEGNGKAKITYVGNKPNRINTKLNNVRYIKDCINGNNSNIYNHWVELQAIKDGINLAKGKTATGLTDDNITAINSVEKITDGDITSEQYSGMSNYITNNNAVNQCIIIDLESNYDLDEIALWHYWEDGRTYNDNVTYVSSDNSSWIEVINKQEPETSEGKRISAYSN